MSQEFDMNVFCVNGSTATYLEVLTDIWRVSYSSLSIFVVSKRKQLLLDCTRPGVWKTVGDSIRTLRIVHDANHCCTLLMIGVTCGSVTSVPDVVTDTKVSRLENGQ